MPRQGDCTAQPLVIADTPEPLPVRVLNGGEIKVLAPDKGRQCLQKPIPRRYRPQQARALIRRAFPGPAQAFVIPLVAIAMQTGVTDGSGRNRRSVRKTYPSPVRSLSMAHILRVARTKADRAS